MSEKLKILLCGDVEGRFNVLFSKVTAINKKAGPFSMLLCVGNFFGVNNKEFEEYTSAKKVVPIPTYILGPNKLEHDDLYPKEESELCHNVSYLGERGLYTLCGGLKIAYISGISNDCIDPSNKNYTNGDSIALRDMCLRGNANFRGVDILLTSQWPHNVTGHIENSKILPDTNFTSFQASWLAVQLKPRYHVSGLTGIYYERPPYRNISEDLATTSRFIGLARVGNPNKYKWLYALSLTPLHKMKINDLLQKSIDETPCPYDVADLNARVLNQKRKVVENLNPYFFNVNDNDQVEKGKHKKQKIVFDQNKCWFCLASSSVEKHLVITIGTSIYLAIAKGGIVPENILICPIEHHQSAIVLSDDVLKEIDSFKEALKRFYAREDKLPVFFERNFKTSHMQIQAIPVPKGCLKEIKQIFKDEAEGNGFELNELDTHNTLGQVIPIGVPYFVVELPTGDTLYTKIQASKGFPINFGRDVLAMGPILNMPERIEWKDCILNKEEESNLVDRIRTDFEPFDITDD